MIPIKCVKKTNTNEDYNMFIFVRISLVTNKALHLNALNLKLTLKQKKKKKYVSNIFKWKIVLL